MMPDLLLLAGAALCAISTVIAVIQLLRMQPPRAAAVMLVIGIVLMFAGAYLDPDPFHSGSVTGAWQRVTGNSGSGTP